MKRYYLSEIFLDTSRTQDPFDVWRHRLQTVTPPVDAAGWAIQIDPATGQPKTKALLVIVGGIDHSRLQNIPGVVPMPNVPHDVKVSSIHTGTKLKAKASIKALGYADADVEATWNNADGHRDVLNFYGRLNHPDFDVNNFDLDES